LIVATRVQRAVATTIATTTSPTKGNADSLVFLKDATVVVQNAVASASVASSPASVLFYILLAHLAALMSWLLD
jgi:hypothetical protein